MAGACEGKRVDVVAPGDRIYSTVANNDTAYNSKDETSIATPHETGVAAMVWVANPGLTEPQVKEIIVDSANNSGLGVVDTRRSVPEDGRITYQQIDANVAVAMAIGTTPELTYGRLTGQVVVAGTENRPGWGF